MEQMHFKVQGDFITGYIRDLALEPNVTKAWETLKATFDHLDEQTLKPVFIELLKGEKEFVGVNEFDYIDSSNSDITSLIKAHIRNAKSEEELNIFSKFFHIPFTKKQEFFLESFREKEENYSNIDFAWITTTGILMEVPYQGHIAFGDMLKEKGLVPEKYPIGEYQWIKITTDTTIFCLNTTPTKEQLKTLEKYLLANKDYYFKVNPKIDITGFGTATIEGPNLGAIVFNNHWKDDLTPYSNPTGRVKRVSIKRAKELISNDKPIYIYKKVEYMRVPSLEYSYTKNQSLFCELSDLYSNCE